jgi:SAM-dependent methyltransferase
MSYERGSTSRIEKFINARFNELWKRILSINDDPIKLPHNFINRQDSAHANEYVLSWLGNLNKIVRIVEKERSLQDLEFLDVGCGTGALLLYAEHKFPFKRFSGFDLQDDLIEIAKKRIVTKGLNEKIEVYKANGSNNIIQKVPQLVFLANPFNEVIYKKFYQNNWGSICETKSYLGLSNDHSIDYVMSLPNSRLIWRDRRRKLSVVCGK